ncbi:cyclic AMP receptor-like protein A [Halichondria panicea]|uniref:cyclic AMP receptor-like protein A n=1 Tax=Halichondria panicea TaxID=6063 RepID=UPI00312B5899
MESSGNGTEAPAYGQCHPTFNDDFKCDIIFWIRCAVAILSMLACTFVVFIILIFKKYKFLHQRLILYLSIAAFFQSLGYAVSDYRIAFQGRNGGEGFCIFVGIWTLFFDWFSFLWVCCITFNIFWNAVFGKRTEKFEKFYFVVCIGVPAILCCLPFIENSYGPSGLWCWIKSSSFDERSDTVKVFIPGVILQFVLFYGPLWIISVILLIVLISIACLTRHRRNKYQGVCNHQVDAQKKLWEEDIRPLVLFPWIYLVILLFPLMNRLRLAFGFFDPDSPANFWFWFSHAFMLTLHGTLYALVFACDKTTRSRITYHQIKAALLQRTMRRRKIKEYPLVSSTEVGGSLSSIVVSDDLTEDGINGTSGSYKLYLGSH